jgi:hypothetical protein
MTKTTEARVFDLLQQYDAEDLLDIIHSCSGWDGSLEQLKWYEFNDDFFFAFFDTTKEAARATFFGEIQNWQDRYIRFNDYDNLESTDTINYDSYDIKEIAEAVIRLYPKIWVPAEVEEILLKVEEEEAC